jgi:DNA polymerase I
MTDTIVLIDGHALVFRAFHALPPFTSPKGELVNAVFGFTSMLFKACRELKPRYVAAAFDTSSQTFRRAAYEAYKGTRGPQPEGIGPQFHHVYRLLEAMSIPVFKLDGYEADDLLGALSKQAVEQGLDVVILTGDMDALQLVGPHVRVLTSRRGFSDTILYDEQAVRDRYGLEPGQLPDFKALRGDASDNIPGVPGIGDKTASKLLATHGTVERLYEQLDSVPARQRELLQPLQDQVTMAKELATIVHDLPVTLDPKQAELRSFERQQVLALFHELGFRSLLDDIRKSIGDGTSDDDGGQLAMFGEASEERAEQADPTGAPTVVGDLAALDALVAQIRAAGQVALNVQTTGTAAMRADIVGLGLGPSADATFYVPVGHLEGDQLGWQAVRERLAPVLEDPAIRKWAHNAKFHELVLARHGVDLRGLDFDTMIAAYLLESSQRALALRDLAWSKLQLEMPAGSTLLGSGRSATTMDRLSIEQVGSYACLQANAVCRLVPILRDDLEECGLAELFCEIELPLVPVLARMERNGIAVDSDYLLRLSRELADRLGEIEASIYGHVGHRFNINSPAQLGGVLYDELKLPRSRRTRTGQASTGAEVLEELRGAHPAIELILEHRQLQKLKSTYIDALPLLVNPETGRVHTSFNQTVAATGRLSSSDPNLQNIPIRTDLGKRVRKAFVTGSADNCLLSADYSQIELRILAHVTRDPTLVEAFAQDLDIHAATAAEVMDVPIEQVNADMRRLAKVVNFGVLYGMSEFGLSQQSGLPPEQAGSFIRRYFERFGTVKAYQDHILREAERRGYVTTLLGRRRYIPELGNKVYAVRAAGQRMAINHPIQGTASDIVKTAMIRVQRFIEERGLKALMVLQVHDELVFEVPRGEIDGLAPELCRIMEGATELSVPLKVDLKLGDNWEEMHGLETSKEQRRPGEATGASSLVPHP